MDGFFGTIGWYPTIGDPSFMGWFTVFAYFCTFIISLKVCSISKYIFARSRQRQKQLWYVIAAIMLFLCVNKQLDLQSFFTGVARYIFKQNDLYEDRREYQELFIIGIALMGSVIAVCVVAGLYKVIKKHWLALIGMFLLMLFVVMRAASFHHMDLFINYTVVGIKMNWLLELSGITLVFLNGILLIHRKSKIQIIAYKKRLQEK